MECHTLGTELEAEHLDGVQSLQGHEVDRLHRAEDEDEGQDGIAGGLVAEDGVAGADGGDKGVGKCAGRCGHADPDDGSTKETCEHHLVTTNFLDELCTDDGEAELFDRVAKLHVGLANGRIDTSGIAHSTHEVGKNAVAALW